MIAMLLRRERETHKSYVPNFLSDKNLKTKSHHANDSRGGTHVLKAQHPNNYTGCNLAFGYGLNEDWPTATDNCQLTTINCQLPLPKSIPEESVGTSQVGNGWADVVFKLIKADEIVGTTYTQR